MCLAEVVKMLCVSRMFVWKRRFVYLQEAAARESVSLPHVKAAASRETLQLGVSQPSPQLGQIHYVRDSESEYDSDEDPDNDLDI